MTNQTTTQTVSLLDLINRFSGRRHLAERTREYYTSILSNFAWYARSNDWPELEGITREHVSSFLDYVATEEHRWPSARRSAWKKATPATIHHYGQVIKALFSWAEDEEYLADNPLRRLKLGPPRYRDVEPYSDDEVYAMLEVCSSDERFRYRYLGTRNRAIISLFVATGLRLNELTQITLADLDPKLQQLRVMGKGAKLRVVPLNGEARKALRRYLEVRPKGGDALWKSDDGQAMTRHGVKIMIVRLRRRAGVDGRGGPHRLRHYFATRFLEAGGDINTLRLLLGHSTLNMSLKYSRFVDMSKALASHEQFSPLDRLYDRRNHRSRDDWGYRE